MKAIIMQDKVSIAATKEKVSNAAARGGKAFMSLIHKVKHSSEDPKPTGTLSELKSPRSHIVPKSPKISSESESPKILSEPDSSKILVEPETLKILVEPETPKILSELKPTETLNDMDSYSDEPTASSPKTSMERKGKLVNRLKQGLKVGKKSTDAESRSDLLGGSPHDQSPRVRSTDSIKAAYGHKPSTDPTSIAAQNREKLIERQERLQAMNMQSEEMVEGAGEFASMAEELAKKIENKPWYKL